MPFLPPNQQRQSTEGTKKAQDSEREKHKQEGKTQYSEKE